VSGIVHEKTIVLLSRWLELTHTQKGVLSIAFRWADDQRDAGNSSMSCVNLVLRIGPGLGGRPFLRLQHSGRLRSAVAGITMGLAYHSSASSFSVAAVDEKDSVCSEYLYLIVRKG
jgi:hypothetical protein